MAGLLHNVALQVIAWILFCVAFLYFFATFLLSRIFIPHLGFRKSTLPEKIPESMGREIMRLKRASRSKMDFLRKAHAFLTKKYSGARHQTYTKFGWLYRSLDEVWKSHGFLHCTHHNLLMRIFLVKSGFFRDSEIKLRHTFYRLNIHQHLLMRHGKKWLPVDCWGAFLGKKIGECSRIW
jgi:hypothetical protein